MKHLDKYQGKEDLPIFMREDWLERITGKLDRGAMTPDQLMNLEITLSQTAARRERFLDEMEEARAEGRRKAKEEMGWEKEKIKEEVIQESKKETAKNLKALGVDYEIISKSTGLTIDEIEAL